MGHQTTQNGTSYKAKLKTVIDQLIPVSSSSEDLLSRLQWERYENKRWKYIPPGHRTRNGLPDSKP